MKFVVYGYGKFFKNQVNNIPLESITAIVDKSVLSPILHEKIPVYHSSKLPELAYDYIVIFSALYFDEIREELINSFFIDSEKILSWTVWYENQNSVYSMCKFTNQVIKSFNVSSMLDVGMDFITKIHKTKNDFTKDNDFSLDGVGNVEFPIYKNIYENVFSDVRECTKKYDIMLLGENELNDDIHLNKYTTLSNRVLLFSKYSIPDKRDRYHKLLSKYGRVTCIPLRDSIAWVLEVDKTEDFIGEKDIQIYVVTHKTYRVLSDNMYRTLCVGNYENNEFLMEKLGDNIAHLNQKINECTAMYWIWKNTNSKYVGLNHYRRYFYNNSLKYYENYLKQDTIEEILERYDIVMSESEPFESTVCQQLEKTILDKEAYEKGYQIISENIEKTQPDYKKAFDTVLQGNHFYICNMFITKREIFNEYCQWLFSFIIDAAEEIDVSGYDENSRRVIGFFAERMWTVWLMKQELKIKELPIKTWM